VVCYTNHALDSFLEDLLDVGIKDIVRVGGRSKSERLEEYSLYNLAGGRSTFTKQQSRRFGQLKQMIEWAQEEATKLERRCSREIGREWWPTVEPHLENEDRGSYRALHLDDSDLVDVHGYQHAGVNGTDYLWRKWLEGKGPAPFNDRKELPLWRLPKVERVQRKLEWQTEVYAPLREQLRQEMKTIERAREEISQLQHQNHEEVLRSRRVIGVTTTKAAMVKDLLDAVAPGIVLVEEAAEIMEAHVLTSISPACERLIMIGDHKQLRPKVEHYPLSVESGRGHDLNCSLFERLADSLPLATLTTQHRMHPEISAIAKLTTYPKLVDAPEVSRHPLVKGVPVRVAFVDHSHPEDSPDGAAVGEENGSKTNKHEVGMVVATVKYLLQQGYRHADLVVLTPYLGQLLLIQKALADADLPVLVDDLDLNEARERLDGIADFDVGAARGDRGSPAVRVATIDNYQGEEANVAVVSLVRGTIAAAATDQDYVRRAGAAQRTRVSIGFLKEPERVNVLFTRAKHGMFVFGNRATMEMAGGDLWRTIYDHMERNQRVFKGLPVECLVHGTPARLATPGDFERSCPAGGCAKPCGNLLPRCGHPCDFRCHPTGPCQKKCKVRVSVKCARGDHDTDRACCVSHPAKCKKKVDSKCNGRLGTVHDIKAPCHVVSPSCDSCDKIDELNRAMEEEKRKMVAARKQWEKEMEVRRTKAQIAKQLQEEKRQDFEAKKSAELEQKKLEIEIERFQREQRLREESSGTEIEEEVRRMHEQAKKDVERLESQLRNQLTNRERQAEEALDKIERDREADLKKMQEEHTALEAAAAGLIRDHEEQLRLDREGYLAEKRRVAEEAAAAEAQRQAQRAELAAIEKAAVSQERVRRDRLRRLAAAEKRSIQEQGAAAEADPGTQLRLAERLRECQCCMDDLRELDGYVCAGTGAHYVCDECFTLQVTAKAKDDLRELEARDGEICCGFCAKDDQNPIGADAILRHAGNEAFDKYLAAKNKLLEKRLAEVIHKEEKARFEAEQQRLARMDEEQREVHRHCQHIREELLTLKCPRCGQAFLDFDGCFALTCSGCGCGFCAWCLKDCGTDAHQHVAECPEGNNRGYHGRKEDFDTAQLNRRKRLVRKYLGDISDGGTRGKVVEQCRKDLEDLQMRDIVHESTNGGGEGGRLDGGVYAHDEELAMGLQQEEGGQEWHDY